MKLILLFLFLSFIPPAFCQGTLTPLEKNNYKSPTSYNSLVAFLKELVKDNSFMQMSFIARSVEGREIPAVKITSTDFEDTSKIRVLIFAQQHGDEHSGKEGSLLLLKEIAGGRLNYIFQRINLIIVPQMNPDGSEKNVRKNSNGKDLNRNHLILTQPETIGLHKIINQYLPEASVDVHEYYPYGEEWLKFGYIKNFDEQIGAATNLNVSKSIRDYSNNQFLPFIKSYLEEKGYSFQNYLLGGPPGENIFRHSTFDINDGRQSMAILNSFSFILEGRNGRDSLDNIKRRTEGQAAAMEGFLEFIYRNKDEIKTMVHKEREKLFNKDQKVVIMMEHVKGDKPLQLSLLSLYSNKDTVISVDEYHSEVKSLMEIEKPEGYLVSKKDSGIVQMLNNHKIKYESYKAIKDHIIEKFFITNIDSIDFEGDKIPSPKFETNSFQSISDPEDYYFIPLNQLHSNMIVLAFEPESMLGLSTYEALYGDFSGFLKKNGAYPVMRVRKQISGEKN
ncbi:MAG TPA: M14 family zinc carboxypeptidase [Ignavibacteriaceae bacterium]|nr:M14 family zinc carboxypeptidase [Ignavibacteriaceae bacterium]